MAAWAARKQNQRNERREGRNNGRRSELLDPALAARLERLSLLTRNPVRGWAAGQRRSRRVGNSVEFLDYRPYGPGDEMRYVDWNIYARTGRPVVKLHVDDEELSLHILVDASASMGFGSPSKLDWACRMAAALGFVGLGGQERVAVSALRDKATEGRPAARGRNQVPPMLEFLSGIEADGNTSLSAALAQYALRAGGRSSAAAAAGSSGGGLGLAVVISDLLDPAGYEAGLSALLEQGFQIHLIHVLSPEELEPKLDGELRLIDGETGATRELTLDGATLARYRERLQGFLGQAEEYCRSHAIDYHRAASDTPPADLLFGELRGHLIE